MKVIGIFAAVNKQLNKNNMIVLGLVAEMAGGKTTAASYLTDKYGAANYGFGIIMRDLANRLHLAPTRENLSYMSQVLRKQFGQDILANAMAEDIKNDTDHEIIVVESIRREEDIKFLKELPGFHLISITADMETRYKRLLTRREKEDDATKTYEQFVQDHQLETELSILPLLERAEFKIDNSGTQEEFFARIDEIISKLKS